MNIIITGDSHTATLKLGLDALVNQGEILSHDIRVKPLGPGGIFSKPFFIDKGDHAQIANGRFRQRLKRLPLPNKKDHSVYYGLSGPFLPFKIWRDKDWLHYTPLATEENKFPVSNSLLRRVVLDDRKYILQLLEVLKRIGVKVFVMEAPMPMRNPLRSDLIDSELITYLDSFYRKTIKEWLDQRGIPVVEVPSDCYDSDGFMYDTYNRGDGHHANDAFGALMIKKAIDLVNTGF